MYNNNYSIQTNIGSDEATMHDDDETYCVIKTLGMEIIKSLLKKFIEGKLAPGQINCIERERLSVPTKRQDTMPSNRRPVEPRGRRRTEANGLARGSEADRNLVPSKQATATHYDGLYGQNDYDSHAYESKKQVERPRRHRRRTGEDRSQQQEEQRGRRGHSLSGQYKTAGRRVRARDEVHDDTQRPTRDFVPLRQQNVASKHESRPCELCYPPSVDDSSSCSSEVPVPSPAFKSRRDARRRTRDSAVLAAGTEDRVFSFSVNGTFNIVSAADQSRKSMRRNRSYVEDTTDGYCNYYNR